MRVCRHGFGRGETNGIIEALLLAVSKQDAGAPLPGERMVRVEADEAQRARIRTPWSLYPPGLLFIMRSPRG